jgi:peptide-methionine (S)-S-oxide reductase
MKVIYLGAGGFWTLDAVYSQVKGVTEVVPGFMGGIVPNPTYEVVATGMTGHAEVVKITYDDTIVILNDLLAIFYTLHDPALPIHSGRGVGSQYRPVIFYTDEETGEAANPQNGSDIGGIQKFIEQLQGTLPEGVPVPTEIMTATEFYPADESQYNYYQQHAGDGYCISIIEPKVTLVKEKFPENF